MKISIPQSWDSQTKRLIELWPEALKWWNGNNTDDPSAEILKLVEEYPDYFVDGKTTKDIIIEKFANDYMIKHSPYKIIPPILHKEVLDYIRKNFNHIIFSKSIHYWNGSIQLSDLGPFERILIPEYIENNSIFNFGKERGQFKEKIFQK